MSSNANRPALGSDPTRLKVLDVGTMIAGPFAAALMGDFGADVIKVERPDGQHDRMRTLPHYWPVEARNKRSITLDLRTDEGRRIIERLACWADVLVENFTPGTMQKWGLGYEQLSALNQRLVYVSVSGYGQTGPNRSLPGYDHVAAAFGGLWHVTGFPDRPPVLAGLAVADYFAGVFAAYGAMEALRRRDAFGGAGRGEWVDVGLYEPIIRIAGLNFTRHSREGVVPERIGSMPVDDRPPSGLPQGVAYETRDHRWVSLFPVSHDQWERLAEVMGMTGAHEFTREAMAKNRRAADPLVRRWVAQQDYEALVQALNAAKIPVSPIQSVADIVADPHVQARGNLIEVPDENGVPTRMQGVVPLLVSQPGAVRWAGESLGMSEPELEDLRTRRII
jgi:crotonobetainyl-CoA:carnitine CoA-transferase CaiB-like acyl-CoA transferase